MPESLVLKEIRYKPYFFSRERGQKAPVLLILFIFLQVLRERNGELRAWHGSLHIVESLCLLLMENLTKPIYIYIWFEMYAYSRSN